MPRPPDALGELTAEVITHALRGVCYPGLTRALVSFGMVEHVSVCKRTREGPARHPHAGLLGHLTVGDHRCRVLRPLGATAVAVEIVLPRATPLPAARRATPDPWADQVRLASVRHVIAVGAGRGGVGMSTVAVNLALALAVDDLREVPCLGAIPFDPEVVDEGDAGTPTVTTRPDSTFALAFVDAARSIAGALGWRYSPPPAVT